MKARFLHLAGSALLATLPAATAHDLSEGMLFAQAGTPQNRSQTASGRTVRTNRPPQAAAFDAFAPKVAVRWDDRWLYVESDGLPSHNMMIGITAWQQQVPLPQNYKGANAWQIPLNPVPAKEPASIRNRFLRGAIALAANGIPIFNPQNNRGEVSAEIGELDEWGGHCGRGDDYHYHAAPLHLQQVLGTKVPIAYALDGYPIFGLTEPDGSAPTGLDSFNGHTTNALGYHYHASKKYPYVNGGFHGEVVEREEQVDPQPRANPVRPALTALRGARIVGFESAGTNAHKLTYDLNGEKRAVVFTVNADGTFPFEFQNGRDGVVKETYTFRSGGAGLGGSRTERGPRRDGERPPRGGDRGGPPPRDDRGGPPPRPEEQSRGGRGEGDGQKGASTIAMDALKKPIASFSLTTSAIGADGKLGREFTGDGDGATPPLTWKGAPAGTKSFAIVMDHLAPGKVVKSYWTLWDIPAQTTSLPKNASGIGKVGTSFKGMVGYEPPHSQGPGEKTYVLTVYALSAPLALNQSRREVNRDVLLTAMQGKVLASASVDLKYDRTGLVGGPQDGPPRREEADRPVRPVASAASAPLEAPDAQIAAQLAAADQPPKQDAPGGRRGPGGKGGPGGPGGKGGGGKGGGDNKGLIKPTMADTIKVNVYADNWFAMFINGELVAVDSIKFTPHNVVSVDILPEYPMTITVLAKDNADPKTGLEYGDHIGDGGLCIKFSDGTVTNATWKAKSFFKGPTNRDVQNPTVEHAPFPDDWWKVDFDDSKWANATEYTEERVNPKQPFFEADFKGAKWIWSSDLDLDNTVIFRTRIEKPGWTKRWNTKPDLDVTGAPLK